MKMKRNQKKVGLLLALSLFLIFTVGIVTKAYAFDYFVNGRNAYFSSGYLAGVSSTQAETYANIWEAEGYCYTQIYARVYSYVDGAWQFEESYDGYHEVYNAEPTDETRQDCTLTKRFSMITGQRCRVQYWGKCFGITKANQDDFIK